jgi:hypothetical protein
MDALGDDRLGHRLVPVFVEAVRQHKGSQNPIGTKDPEDPKGASAHRKHLAREARAARAIHKHAVALLKALDRNRHTVRQSSGTIGDLILGWSVPIECGHEAVRRIEQAAQDWWHCVGGDRKSKGGASKIDKVTRYEWAMWVGAELTKAGVEPTSTPTKVFARVLRVIYKALGFSGPRAEDYKVAMKSPRENVRDVRRPFSRAELDAAWASFYRDYVNSPNYMKPAHPVSTRTPSKKTTIV